MNLENYCWQFNPKPFLAMANGDKPPGKEDPTPKPAPNPEQPSDQPPAKPQ